MSDEGWTKVVSTSKKKYPKKSAEESKRKTDKTSKDRRQVRKDRIAAKATQLPDGGYEIHFVEDEPQKQNKPKAKKASKANERESEQNIVMSTKITNAATLKKRYSEITAEDPTNHSYHLFKLGQELDNSSVIKKGTLFVTYSADIEQTLNQIVKDISRTNTQSLENALPVLIECSHEGEKGSRALICAICDTSPDVFIAIKDLLVKEIREKEVSEVSWIFQRLYRKAPQIALLLIIELFNPLNFFLKDKTKDIMRINESSFLYSQLNSFLKIQSNDCSVERHLQFTKLGVMSYVQFMEINTRKDLRDLLSLKAFDSPTSKTVMPLFASLFGECKQHKQFAHLCAEFFCFRPSKTVEWLLLTKTNADTFPFTSFHSLLVKSKEFDITNENQMNTALRKLITFFETQINNTQDKQLKGNFKQLISLAKSLVKTPQPQEKSVIIDRSGKPPIPHNYHPIAKVDSFKRNHSIFYVSFFFAVFLTLFMSLLKAGKLKREE